MWILHGNKNASKTDNFVSFKTFWENAVQIVVYISVPASQHSYGMAATDNDTDKQSLLDPVSNFGTAYPTTQESL